jgi:SAM-dependent methyltransferase
MNLNLNNHDLKQVALNLIAHIMENAAGLNSVLWSQEELISNQEFMNLASNKINDTIEMIAKNFYWYQKIGWKKFLSNPEQTESQMIEKNILKEKERISDWFDSSMPGFQFYFDFHHQVPEGLILNQIVKHESEPLNKRFVLDVGCRDGFWLKKLLVHGFHPENLAGIEPCDNVSTLAVQAFNNQIEMIRNFPDKLPFENERFHMVLVFGMLMHVLDENLQKRIGAELLRVLSKDGIILAVNAGEQLLSGLEPYIAYATQVLNLDDLHEIFPDCNVQFEAVNNLTLAVVTRNFEPGER